MDNFGFVLIKVQYKCVCLVLKKGTHIEFWLGCVSQIIGNGYGMLILKIYACAHISHILVAACICHMSYSY